MKVKRTAWHYKLYCLLRQSWDSDDGPFTIPLIIIGRSKRRTYQPSSLCKYFWFTVFNTIAIPIVLILIAVIGIIIVPPVYAVLFIKDWWNEPVRVARRREKRLAADKKLLEESRKVKTPNLFIEFIKARKAKACPLIELVD